LNLGVNDDKVGQYAVKSFCCYRRFKGLVDVLVTAPISTTFNQKNLSPRSILFKPGIEGNALMLMVAI
jgi:4-hydroxythreonine-4-phosphate dehydrogenase